MMRLIFEALFFRAARIWFSEGGTKSLASKGRDRQVSNVFFAAIFFPRTLFFGRYQLTKGGAKSLGSFVRGPVVLFRTQKVGIKYKKPSRSLRSKWFTVDIGRGTCVARVYQFEHAANMGNLPNVSCAPIVLKKSFFNTICQQATSARNERGRQLRRPFCQPIKGSAQYRKNSPQFQKAPKSAVLQEGSDFWA
jgi:hypothetical protein